MPTCRSASSASRRTCSRRVADVQKNVKGIELEPKALRQQATTVVNARVDAVTKDAKARRAAVEARIADLQADAKAQATKVQTVVTDNVTTVTDTYAELAKRGETTLKRLRGEVAGALDEVADTVDAPKTADRQEVGCPQEHRQEAGREEGRREEDHRQEVTSA